MKKNISIFTPVANEEQTIEKFIIEILLALDYLHDHEVIHRDIKPSNIFLKGKDYSV